MAYFKFTRSNKIIWGSVTGVVLILLGILVYKIWPRPIPEPPKQPLANIPCVQDPTINLDEYGYTSPSDQSSTSLDYGNSLAINAMNCDLALNNKGLVDYTMIQKDSSLRTYYSDLLYQENFQSKEDLINFGYSASVPIPDVPALLDASGNFNKSGYQEWRSKYKSTHQNITDGHLASLYIRQEVPEMKYKYWLACYKLKYENRPGFFAINQPLSLDSANFSRLIVKFNQVAGFTETEFIRDIYIRGGKPVCASIDDFRKGRKITGTPIELLIKRDPGKPLFVQVFPKNKEAIPDLNLPVFPVGLIRQFNIPEKSGSVIVGDSITLVWYVLNGKSVKLNGELVPSIGQKKVLLTDTSLKTYELTSSHGKARNGLDSISKSEVTFQAIPKPTLLQATYSRYIMATPDWGDGKNDDNSNVDVDVTVITNAGQIVGHGQFGNQTGIAQGAQREMTITFDPNQAKSIKFDEVLRIDIAIKYKNPNVGMFTQDQWRARTQLILSFDQGKQLVTPGVDPAHDFQFSDSDQYKYEHFERVQLGDRQTLQSPCH